MKYMCTGGKMRSYSIPNRKRFNGEIFLLHDSGYPNKFKAKSDAIKLRNQGYNVRVVHTPSSKNYHEYSLYRRRRK